MEFKARMLRFQASFSVSTQLYWYCMAAVTDHHQCGLETTQIYYLTVLQFRSLTEQGHMLSAAAGGESVSSPLLAPGDHLHSLARVPFLHLQSHQRRSSPSHIFESSASLFHFQGPL